MHTSPPSTEHADTPIAARIQFTGSGRSYFGIWIVNLLLSIVTLGIYSAWAKVRRKKYFYQHTLLDGASFDYHARPVAILKGRMIAVALFLLYNLLAKSNPILAGILFLLFMIAVPWLVVRSTMFNARNTSYRGLRFDFTGRSGEAAKVFVAYPMLLFFTLGLIYPFIKQRAQTFLINHHRFGTQYFSCSALVSSFYGIYLKMVMIVIGLGLLFTLGVKTLLPHHVAWQADTPVTVATGGVPGHPLLSLARADNHLSAQEQAELDRALEALDIDESAPASLRSELHNVLIGLAVIVAYLFVLSLFWAYLNSRISNLVWNHTRIADARFTSAQRMRDLVWIYGSNLLMLVVTLGLATPFAQIRLARYRLQALTLHGIHDWDQFIGEQKDGLRATGEEIAEMFDVDISFG